MQRFDSPFTHWILDGFAMPFTRENLFSHVPDSQWPGWEARYENDCERGKRTCRRMPTAALEAALDHLSTDGVVQHLRELTGISDLQADPTLHGAGLHVTEPGGWLVQHLDYAVHPKLDLERRVNLVYFLNPKWDEKWGGAFELGDEMGNVVKRVYPAPCRAVVWLPGDTAFHGTQRVLCGTDRATLAVYYLASKRPGAHRRRALFCPNRT